MPNYNIRFVAANDLPALQTFFHQHWRADHIMSRDAELLKWQYGRCHAILPEGAEFSFLIVEADDRIVGILGFIPVDFNQGGEIVPGAWLSHWLVLEEYRAGGAGLLLFRRLRDLGVQVIAVQGINDTVKKLYGSLGFHIIDDVPRWVGILDPARVEALVADVGVQLEAGEMDEFAIPAGSAAEATCTELVSAPLGDEWDHFWADASATVMGAVRDADFLNWRYLRHPSFDYRLVLARNREQRLEGLAAYRVETIRDRVEKVLRVTDLIATDAGAAALVEGIRRTASEQGAVFADFYCSSQVAAAPLQEAGFARLRPGPGIGRLPSRFQPLDAVYVELSGAIWAAAGKGLIEHPGFYLSKADGDVDRPN